MTFDLYLAAFVARPNSDLDKVHGETLSFVKKVCADIGHEWKGPSCSRCLLRHSEFLQDQQNRRQYEIMTGSHNPYMVPR